MSLIHLVILSAMTYRIARFLVLDTLIEVQRDKVYAWLASHPSTVSLKLIELLSCPYCITIWVAAAVTVFWDLAVTSWSGWAFLGYWLTAATGAIIIWTYVDADD